MLLSGQFVAVRLHSTTLLRERGIREFVSEKDHSHSDDRVDTFAFTIHMRIVTRDDFAQDSLLVKPGNIAQNDRINVAINELETGFELVSHKERPVFTSG